MSAEKKEEYNPDKDPTRPRVGDIRHNANRQIGDEADYEVRKVTHVYRSDLLALKDWVGGYDLRELIAHESRVHSFWEIFSSKKGWNVRIPHEYLDDEDSYESSSVGTRAHGDKTCDHCGKVIPKGMPHTMMKFYGDGDYPTYPVHNECEQLFEDSLLKSGETRADDMDEDAYAEYEKLKASLGR